MNRTALSKLAQRTAEPPISWLMKLSLERPQMISLAAGFTDNATLPVIETAALLATMLDSPKTGRPTLQYGNTQGDAALRKLTMERLQKADKSAADAAYDPAQVVVTHGSQQLLYLVTECLCDEGDIVIVEDPTYFVYLGILQSRGVEARGVPLREDGVDIERLETLLERLDAEGKLPRLKMLYLVTYFQNPSTVTTSLAKKEAALALLKRYEKKAGHPIYLLEDAAYRELRFSGPDVASAVSLTKYADRCIYAGTYSKPYATGIRVGFGTVPEPLRTAVLRVKGNHDFGTSHLLQQILRAALSSGEYAKHLPVLQARYSGKARVMADAVTKNFPATVKWTMPTGGLYIWAVLPGKLSAGPTSKLFKTAMERDVLYVPGELCYAQDPTRTAKRNEMRLSFGGATEKNITEGISRLGAVIKEMI